MFDITTRPDSPIYQETKREADIRQFRTDIEKVHRIRCLAEYSASVVDVVSPSEIWIRPVNHIADRLTEPLNGTQPHIRPDQILLNMYVLAPLSKQTLARARIINVADNDRVFVRFLDHGFVAMFKQNMFYELPKDLRTHPWQTIPVMLFHAQPARNEMWSVEEVDAIRTVLNSFDCFWIVPQFTQKLISDDSQYIRVVMYGLSADDIESIEVNSHKSVFDLGENVLDSYSLLLEPTFFPDFVDAYDQQFYAFFDKDFLEHSQYHVEDLPEFEQFLEHDTGVVEREDAEDFEMAEDGFEGESGEGTGEEGSQSGEGTGEEGSQSGEGTGEEGSQSGEGTGEEGSQNEEDGDYDDDEESDTVDEDIDAISLA